ncbi:hypothetical protein D1818_04235 [Aquimarina sp. BL5]|uniref:hypothetical protein n=1 Tax=Aquimarina sp. BL5 TaxID=1714860 RepID=UPI000E4CC20A|nr:hypothetical protein [Aquimarina sp. BL5]AXT50076.1 hypothetical protein D1818_04235 [Aquimarina sp. BL5]RKM95149.1 hypothetical protein D7036_21460 [Aquimarina sp. BL5]
MTDILKLVRIQILLIILFVVFKFIRPAVLNNGFPQWIKITLLSLPNFFEAFIGTLILTGIGLYLNLRILSRKRQIKRNLIYVIAPILAGIYVITQELKLHNLGGNNVYDSNDIVFSVIGLITGYLIVILIKPRIYHVVEE